MRALTRALLIASLSTAGCQSSYPIEPTPCDDWCDVTHGLDCWSYDPAGCVAICEESGSTNERCRPSFDVALACFRSTPAAAAQHCVYPPVGELPCQDELNLLSICISFNAPL